jgi:hypothetical protein
MMPKFNLKLPALYTVVLLCTFTQGCAQKGSVQKFNAQSEVCRTCHAPGAVARDFGPLYANPKPHHSVGVEYPRAGQANFKQPDGKVGEIAFFDMNNNGVPDSDEIQLYGADAVTVECASCHQEHGVKLAPTNAPANTYLRVANKDSALCVICHNL